MKQVHGRWLTAVAAVALGVLMLAAVDAGAKQDADGWLGVVIQNIDKDLQESEGLPSDEGVIITRVIDDSPAEKAGLQRGDVILKFDDRDARSVRRLTRMIEWARPGEKVNLVILRDGKEMPVVVEIGEREDDDEFFGWHGGDFDVDVPPMPDIPRIPRSPRAYTFSLGQLSGSHIGVSLYELSDQLAEQFGAKDGGALINEVFEDSPAEKAGLKAGDIIVEVDHKKVDDIDDIRKIISDKEDGEKVAIRVLRPMSNEELTVDVEVEERNTWSGVGNWRRGDDSDFRFYSRGDSRRAPRAFFWDNDEWREAMERWKDSDAMNEWRDELRKELEDLREELNDLKDELREKGY
ncbi:MAG: hypothetical protein Kow0074_20550 [Candidatus Zixiibacteriota bacterium]